MTGIATQGLQAEAGARAPYRLQRSFRGLREAEPGAAWADVLHAGWPGWRDWYTHRGRSAAEHEHEAVLALRRSMPEMEGLLDRLGNARPHDPLLREFLGFWRPPRYLAACTQAVGQDAEGPFLIRNYDLDPAVSEATLLQTEWRGRRVTGMVEALAGLSDGMNESGLAVSLSFGGRAAVGPGFGIPLIMRYLLEVCTDVREAMEALKALPCHMAYNVTAVDAAGGFATAYLSPDRPTVVLKRPWATNHQFGVELQGHGRATKTLERSRALSRLYRGAPPSARRLGDLFAGAPFFSRNYRGGFGTVFTALYRPRSGDVTLGWGCRAGARWNARAFEAGQVDVLYDDGGSRIAA